MKHESKKEVVDMEDFASFILFFFFFFFYTWDCNLCLVFVKFKNT